MTIDLEDTSAYEYRLPPTSIAAQPADQRDQSRLMVLHGDAAPVHARFDDILDWLSPGDLLVVNDVRVMPCRVMATKPTGGRVEILVLNDAPEHTDAGVEVRAFVGSRRPVKPGDPLKVELPDGSEGPVARLLRREEDGVTVVCFETEDLGALMDACGKLPLPPYIVKRRREMGDDLWDERDRERYQTVFARGGRAVAAPTAGLHFTDALLDRIRAKGVVTAEVTLEVGPGTFKPIRAERLDDHHMHAERYSVSPELVAAYAAAREKGGRVVAVGTTVVRVLEDQVSRFGRPTAGDWETSMFIRPGYAFGAVDALVTNFHLPGSTLLVLVTTFAGYAGVMAAYREAVDTGYRFYSYGDAMLIIPRGPDAGNP